MSDPIGELYGNYRIERQLGAGGMGRVYLGRHQHLDWLAAVKVMHPFLAVDTTFRSRFLREGLTTARLDHPNIIKLLDFGEHGDALYLVMEFIPDGSLRSLLGRRDEPEAGWSASLGIDLVRQAASGLDYAHAGGAVHRDIKSDNLLLKRETGTDGAPRYTVKITDFGLAQIAEGSALTASGAMFGTPAYMSPEQCQGQDLDARSDIYSLGVILYEVATGRLPFATRTISDAVYHHVFVPPPPPGSVLAGVPGDLEDIILRCLSKRPDDRFATAGELAQALDGVLTGQPPAVPESPPAPSPVSAAAPGAEQVAPRESPDITVIDASPVAGQPHASAADRAPAAPPVRSRAAGSRRKLLPIAAVALLLAVLVVAGAVALVMLGDDDDPEAGAEPAAPSSVVDGAQSPAALGDAAHVIEVAQLPTVLPYLGAPLTERRRASVLHQEFENAVLFDLGNVMSDGGIVVATLTDDSHGTYVHYRPEDIAALPEITAAPTVSSESYQLDPPFDRLLLGDAVLREQTGNPAGNSDGRAVFQQFERGVIVWLNQTSRVWVLYGDSELIEAGEWEAIWVPIERETIDIEKGAEQIALVAALDEERAELGEPVGEPHGTAFRAQEFERGLMIDTGFLAADMPALQGAILALTQAGSEGNGTLKLYGLDEYRWARWDESPPPDRYPASYPFSLVWANDPALRAQLRWSWNPDTHVTGVYQLFERGMVIWAPSTSRVWVIIGDPADVGGAYWTAYSEQ